MKDLMKRMYEADELRLDRLKYYAKAVGDKELAAFLQGGADPTRLQDNSMVSNTKTLLKLFVASLDYASAESNFSVCDWVRTGRGFIFITPRENERTALMLLINTFMNLVVKEAQSPPTGKRNKPIALVVDELSSFDFDDLQGVLEKGRKFGLVAFAGIQNIAQLEQKYSEKGAQVLMSCFLTKIVFNPGDEYTGKDMAGEIGEHIVERLEVSHTTSSKGGSTTTRTWKRSNPEPLILSSDLRLLSPLQAYVKLIGNYPVAKITLRYS
jgi:type IV secretory pathway TraG/TraD family ATPase VirD4